MSTTTMTTPALAGTGAFTRLAALVGTVALRLAHFARAYRNRRDFDILATFDDRMLADIGLTRGDIRDAVAQPLWRDPSHVLVARVRERRIWRRTVATRAGGPIPSPSLVPDPELQRMQTPYY